MEYRITFPVFATVTVTVEANDLDTAHERACDKADAGLCHDCAESICTDGGIDEEGAVAEVDGETYTLKSGVWVKED